MAGVRKQNQDLSETELQKEYEEYLEKLPAEKRATLHGKEDRRLWSKKRIWISNRTKRAVVVIICEKDGAALQRLRLAAGVSATGGNVELDCEWATTAGIAQSQTLGAGCQDNLEVVLTRGRYGYVWARYDEAASSEIRPQFICSNWTVPTGQLLVLSQDS